MKSESFGGMIYLRILKLLCEEWYLSLIKKILKDYESDMIMEKERKEREKISHIRSQSAIIREAKM